MHPSSKEGKWAGLIQLYCMSPYIAADYLAFSSSADLVFQSLNHVEDAAPHHTGLNAASTAACPGSCTRPAAEVGKADRNPV